jgi:site-specific recombinase XerD
MEARELGIERAATLASRQHLNSQQLAIAWLEWVRDVRGRSKNTVRAYASTIEAYLRFLDVTDVRHATRAQMEAFILRPRARRAHGNVGSPATQRRDIACLRMFYGWMHEEGITGSNLALGLHGPTVHNQNPRPIPDEDWEVLWGTHMGYDSIDAKVVLGLGFFCGLRRHEIVALKQSQFYRGKIVNFVRKGGGEDVLPYVDMVGVIADRLPHLMGPKGSDSFLGAIEHMRELHYRGGYVTNWGTRDPDAINKRMKKWCAKAGIPPYTPHQLRHSCATNLLRAGVPLHLVQRLMNHSSPETTMRYVRASGDELREWRKNL